MPIPPPHQGEKQGEYIARCMSFQADENPNLPQNQKLAICYSTWRRAYNEDMHPHFQRIYDIFTARYGEKAQEHFDNFLAQNRLNPQLPYDTHVQLKESFEWAKPYIYKLREDKNAKYYAINCIDAIVSMNDNDYRNWEHMMKAGESMNYRPVNINHDPNRYLPYPRTRLDYAKAEDYAVEGILRVDNRDHRFQQQLEHDKSIPEKEWINHPSIEGRPNLGGKDDGYHFTAISFLEKGYKLPGDPLSSIAPIIFESIGESNTVCLLIDDSKVCLPCLEQIPSQCICPECGEIINNTEDKHCNEIECPECGANMRARAPASGGGRGLGGPSENLENDQSRGDNMSQEYQSGPLQRGGAICPSCGKIIPETVTDVTEIECPVCGTSMVEWDLKTYEMSVIPEIAIEQLIVSIESIPEDAEWVTEVAGFNPTADWPDSCFAYVPASAKGADGNKSERKFPYKWPDDRISLPNVRNALARLANSSIPVAAKARIKALMQRIMKRENPDYQPSEEVEAEELVKELFRPPFPFTPNPMFNKTGSLVFTPIPSVGSVHGARIGIVEATQEIADLTEQLMTVRKEKLQLEEELRVERNEKASLLDKVAVLETDNTRVTALKMELTERIDKTSTLQADINHLKGEIETKEQLVKSKNNQIKELEQQIDDLNTTIGSLNARIETLATELSESLGKTRKHQENSISAQRDKGRFQEDNAKLMEERARDTRKISELTDKMADQARQIQDLEAEAANTLVKHREEKQVLEAKLTASKAEVDKARKYLKWANKALVEAGWFKVQT